MHSRILGERVAKANNRLVAAADTLAERFGLVTEVAALRSVAARDPQVLRLKEMEATADLLEALATATLEVDADVPAVPTVAEVPPASLSITDLAAHVAGLADVAELNALLAAEQEGRARKGAIQAIAGRLSEIAAAAVDNPPPPDDTGKPGD